MRIVIKIGTSTLTHKSGNMNIRGTEELCKIISDIKNQGNEVIMVSSGAIARGVGKLSLKHKPTDIETKKAAAALHRPRKLERGSRLAAHPRGQGAQ